MPIPFWLNKSLQTGIDFIFSSFPRSRPMRDRLSKAKLIAHRGEFDNRTVLESTIPAFQAAIEAGVWGIEFDIRWTRDDVPVVHHDSTARRLFHQDIFIERETFADLRSKIPQIPTLEEVLQLADKRVHLMIEIKRRADGFSREHRDSLRESLKALEPITDYHILALYPEIFDAFDWLPRKACLPVAEVSVTPLSRCALEREYGGLTGHYALITPNIQRRHEDHGQKVGTGFIGSRNCLYRELNRGVEWLFSNEAVRMKRMIDKLIAKNQ